MGGTCVESGIKWYASQMRLINCDWEWKKESGERNGKKRVEVLKLRRKTLSCNNRSVLLAPHNYEIEQS